MRYERKTSVEASPNIDGKVVEVKKDLFTLSNLVSVTRMLVPIPIILLGSEGGRPEPLFSLLVAWCIVSDYLDGYLARLLNQRSELGKVLDPLADKVCALLLFVYAVWIGHIPLWFLGLVITRDLLILAGSYYILREHRKVAMSVMSGKVAVNALALLWISVMYFPEHDGAKMFLMVATLVLMVYSFIEYYWRFRKIRQGARFN